MLLSDVKKSFEMKLKSSGGYKMPEDDELSEIVYEAMVYVASVCLPRELLRDESNSEDSVLRFISGGDFVTQPVKPDFTSNEDHLLIDEDLTFAVINKAVALYSRDMNDIARFENEAKRVINRYKANYNKLAAANG